MNIAGSPASKDPNIFEAVKGILKSLLYPPPEDIVVKPPHSFDIALERIISELPLKVKKLIAKTVKGELSNLNINFGIYIHNNLSRSSDDEKLRKLFQNMAKMYDLDKDGTSDFILGKIWKKLKESHGLRVVK